MQGFFVRKPQCVKDAEKIISWSTKHRDVPVEINPIGEAKLTYERYMRFCNEPLQEWGFLKPYAEVAVFHDETHADCVIVWTSGQRRIAVCLEGYCYPRYVAYTL